MARLKEKIAYALGDAAAGGIVWKVMSIAFPLFFTNVVIFYFILMLSVEC
jgi:glycoside/pentoside/hexuronide:cation symporter, GPH family